MKLYALDTLHITSVGPDNIRPGEPFDVSDADAKSLVDRGLASETSPGHAAKVAKPAKPATN